jgi:hypothetical protein
MDTHDFRAGQNEVKVGSSYGYDNCPHRLTLTGVYYAVIRHQGKLHRRSL